MHGTQNLLTKHINHIAWENQPQPVRNDPEHKECTKWIVADILEIGEILIEPFEQRI